MLTSHEAEEVLGECDKCWRVWQWLLDGPAVQILRAIYKILSLLAGSLSPLVVLMIDMLVACCCGCLCG